MVHQLERKLDVKLIDRSKRPFVLTPEGEAYYHGCRHIVDRYEQLESEVRTLHDAVAGRVVVASIYSIGLYHMNRYLKGFLARHPKAHVRLEYHHPDRVYELVENDEADLGLVSYPKSSRTLRALVWREEPMVLVCAPDHRLAGHKSVRWGQLKGRGMVTFVRNLKIRQAIEKELIANDADVNVVMEFDNIETIKRAIEIDAGWSLLPEPTVQREIRAGTLVAVPLEDPRLTRPLGIIHRKGKALGRTAERFIQFLQEAVGGSWPSDANDTGDSDTRGNGAKLPDPTDLQHADR